MTKHRAANSREQWGAGLPETGPEAYLSLSLCHPPLHDPPDPSAEPRGGCCSGGHQQGAQVVAGSTLATKERGRGSGRPLGLPSPPGLCSPHQCPGPKGGEGGLQRRGAALGAHLHRWRGERKEGSAAESHTDNVRPVFLCLVITKCVFLRLDKPATRATADPYGKGGPAPGYKPWH